MPSAQILIPVMIFAYGLVIGSFLNVVIYRLPRGENLAYPGSHCPTCDTRLKPIDLIPVFSFLRTGGKCRYCGLKISIIYPAIELLNAASYMAIYYIKGLSYTSVLLMLASSVMICIAMIDLAHYRIPNVLNLSLVILAVIAIIIGALMPASAAIGAVIGAAILLLLNGIAQLLKAKAFGMGDVKYMFAIGALLGFPCVIYVLLYTSIVAGVIVTFNLITKRWTTKTVFAFGPFLVIGSYIAMLFY